MYAGSAKKERWIQRDGAILFFCFTLISIFVDFVVLKLNLIQYDEQAAINWRQIFSKSEESYKL